MTCVPVTAHAPTYGHRGPLYLQLQLIDTFIEGGKTPTAIIADIQNLDSVLKSGNGAGPVMTMSSVHRSKVRTERKSAAAALSLGRVGSKGVGGEASCTPRFRLFA